ncbi:hypothetical protein Nstercoris_02319 (plasmid) [Nitrosomonas stercoris]|uniref:Uncharacterized protein n=1 Tax=Nitrosomonas stercoris TaxID=1444684 RepID=A0A4Y1YPE2_9PROT|nr:hypothetical protein Nstercoris_02319 [Nitrosomonas stercoris]
MQFLCLYVLKMMNNLAEAIKSLPKGSNAAILKDFMPIIDQQIKNGVSHKDILDLLNKNGIRIKLNTLRSYLYRYRKSNNLTRE